MALKRKLLGERLIETGLITKEQLELALQEQRRTKEFLGNILKNLGFITEEQLSLELIEGTGVQYTDLFQTIIDPQAIKLVSESFARKYCLIPISLDNNILTIAMGNAFDIVAIDELQNLTHYYIEVLAATESSIIKTIDKYYLSEQKTDQTFESIITEALKQISGVAVKEEEVAMKAPIIKLVNELITKAIRDEATDIHIEPETKVLRTRYRIDGILQQGPSLPVELKTSITTRIKIMSELDISEMRIPQDGKISFKTPNKNIDLRVSTFPTINGENLVLRVLDSSQLVLGLERLGLNKRDFKYLTDAITRPSGIMLVTGPTGSGKTTTLYSSLLYLNSLELNIVTLEDPVEYEFPIIRQSQINPKAGYTFAAGLRSILRQDPNVILVGEMRDKETIELAIRSALTGHLVLSTLHTNSAAAAFARLTEMGIEPFLSASSIIAIIAQRLIRVICPNCKEAYTPENRLIEQLKEKGITGEINLYHGKGCEKCNQTGFKGRMSIFELLKVSPNISRLVMEKTSANIIQEEAVKEGMQTMLNNGIQKALKGITTLEEVLTRVTA
ncbi:MAG: ATPase, T2SS/T4P/T4SS family [bacterium]